MLSRSRGGPEAVDGRRATQAGRGHQLKTESWWPYQSSLALKKKKKKKKTLPGAEVFMFSPFFLAGPLCLWEFRLVLVLLNLRHHYRARNWTFDENHFLVSFYNGSSGENRVKKFSGEVGIKCHQSCLVALVFLYKVVHKTGRFSVFIFTIFFFLLTFKRLMPWSWNLAHFLSVVFSPIPC